MAVFLNHFCLQPKIKFGCMMRTASVLKTSSCTVTVPHKKTLITLGTGNSALESEGVAILVADCRMEVEHLHIIYRSHKINISKFFTWDYNRPCVTDEHWFG
jgi:hypothetical protein